MAATNRSKLQRQAREMAQGKVRATAADQAAIAQEAEQRRDIGGIEVGEYEREHRLQGKPRSHGFGESRRFINPETADEPNPIEACHFNGVPFGELPPDQQRVLRALPNAIFAADEHLHRGAFNPPHRPTAEELEARPRRGPKTDFSRFSGREQGEEYRNKVLGPRRDALRDYDDPFHAPNPTRELIEKYVPRGYSAKKLSKRVIQDHGMRGYELVRDEKGNPVEIGNMLLGMRPTAEVAQARRRTKALHEELIKGSVREYGGEERMEAPGREGDDD